MNGVYFCPACFLSVSVSGDDKTWMRPCGWTGGHHISEGCCHIQSNCDVSPMDCESTARERSSFCFKVGPRQWLRSHPGSHGQQLTMVHEASSSKKRCHMERCWSGRVMWMWWPVGFSSEYHVQSSVRVLGRCDTPLGFAIGFPHVSRQRSMRFCAFKPLYIYAEVCHWNVGGAWVLGYLSQMPIYFCSVFHFRT